MKLKKYQTYYIDEGENGYKGLAVLLQLVDKKWCKKNLQSDSYNPEEEHGEFDIDVWNNDSILKEVFSLNDVYTMVFKKVTDED